MQYAVTTPPESLPVDWLLAKAHLRLDGTEEKPYVESLIAVAADHAQEAMACSLVSQTITAAFTIEDLSPGFINTPYTESLTYGRSPSLKLPRGPVTAITSVTDAQGAINPSAYTLGRVGNADLIRINVGYQLPLTVVYVAGYRIVPPAIKHAILMHAATLFYARESVTDKAKVPVPHSLEAFYAQRSRLTGVA